MTMVFGDFVAGFLNRDEDKIGEADCAKRCYDFYFTFRSRHPTSINVDDEIGKSGQPIVFTDRIQCEATFDAFGFVQASKRDGTLTLHDPIFNFTCITESSRNACDVIGVHLLLDDAYMVTTEPQVILIQLIPI
ncbi:uncharacterized protein EV154DRAFT_564387 [Mucor mucedo]|uniref:uncharacterized protein n=1 Tax=Mucor mucedo TaxID=29922 RepID=UPI002220A625|nr:uncharacterized protein EV154DRAFT_564387 [Mucor mucedo]KAI7890386.1 hypothetical protein EV154DRAFT_564387 [Mucor mucedo]